MRSILAFLRGLLHSAATEYCSFCGLPLEDGPYHEWRPELGAWFCKTLIVPVTR